jgi:hypothetical protein
MFFEGKNTIESAKQEKNDIKKVIFGIIKHGRTTQDLQKKEKYRELLKEKIRTGAINREFIKTLTKHFNIPNQEEYIYMLDNDTLYRVIKISF